MNTTPQYPVTGGAGAPGRRLSTVRIICGVIWAVIALICAAGAVGELTVHIIGGAILCLVIAAGSAWYDYRVWTRRTRRLILILVTVREQGTGRAR